MKIIFTGGGTAGHISLNLALIPHFIELGYEVHYIGSKNGMEKEIIKELKNVISTIYGVGFADAESYVNMLGSITKILIRL